MHLLALLPIGALVGWLAGVVMRGRGLGITGNIVVGVIGAFLGGWLLPTLGIRLGDDIGTFIVAVLGAMVLMLLVGIATRA